MNNQTDQTNVERAIALRSLGDHLIVEVEADGRWVEVIREYAPHEGTISHIVEPLGINQAIGQCEATYTVPSIPDGEPWTVGCDRGSGHAGQHRSDVGCVLWGPPTSTPGPRG